MQISYNEINERMFCKGLKSHIVYFSQAARLRRADPTFGGLRPPKVGVPPPPSRKKIWETTRKNRPEQGFHSGGTNTLFHLSTLQIYAYLWELFVLI